MRSSNGWGLISVPGGRLAPVQGQRAYYTAQIQQQLAGQDAFLHSESQTHNVELNDTIKWQNWTFNVGVLLSKDTLYGQGLRDDSSTLSGYVSAPGNKYDDVPDPVQQDDPAPPRRDLGVQRQGHRLRELRQVHPVGQLAAARRVVGPQLHRDLRRRALRRERRPLRGGAGGVLVGQAVRPRHDAAPDRASSCSAPPASSPPAGPRALYGRYREGSHFWEDTNNNARVAFEPPPGIPRELYIPDLAAQLAQIGSGSSYVIAELDGAYTKYWEATVESEWRGDKTFVRGSYTWSHYYGNFDQDDTTGVDNDAERLHRLVQHRRRRGTPALGLQGRRSRAATGPTC